MAKKVYVGVNNTAKQVKKVYVGINNVAKKVKKIYVGVANIARLIFGGASTIVYNAPVHSLPSSSSRFHGASNDNYMMFAGGFKSNIALDTVSAYSSSLVYTSAPSVDVTFCNGSACSLNGRVLFAGGDRNGSRGAKPYVYSYTNSLTKSNLTDLSDERAFLAACSDSAYALFGGGSESGGFPGLDAYVSNVVDAYSSSFSLTGVASLNTARGRLAAACLDHNYLFAGGSVSGTSGGSHYNIVDAYSSTLTHSVIASLSDALDYLVGCSFSDYAVFGTGCNGNSRRTSFVDFYNKSLTKIAGTYSAYSCSWATVCAFGEFAIMSGGSDDDGDNPVSTVGYFDSSLTFRTTTDLPHSTTRHASASLGDYCLFAGGFDGGSNYFNDVYSYKLS